MSASSTEYTALYDSLHETPMQRKLRALAPMPVGAVFIERPGMTEDRIRGHFRLMKQLGFNCLKQLCCCQGTSKSQVMHWALDEGIIPWWYGEAGWERISDQLLERLGIPAGTPVAEIRDNPRFLAHQEQLMRTRIDVEAARSGEPSDQKLQKIFSFDPRLEPGSEGEFTEWLEKTYGTLDSLAKAWNMDQSMVQRPRTAWESWDDVRATVGELLGVKEYRRRRDVIRFKADIYLRMLEERMQRQAAADPEAPQRAGGEMGLFLPFAARATDMEGIADTMAEYGSFYPSIHLAWHFEETGFHAVPEVYLQASLAVDWFKGGWSATWESTGGPQQLSGGKGLIPEVSDTIAGFTVDENTMAQLMMSYLAAGFKGFGLWCWNSRGAGWEAGEYALLDRNDEPGPRARAAGAIGRAAVRYRDEIWQAHKEPVVGVLCSFESDAIWAAASLAGRDRHKYMGVQARVGIARALCRCNVPWEHVTPDDLRNGLASRYAVIHLPAMIALETDVVALLERYVDGGGRVVLDMPSAWYDEYGRLLPTGAGSAFERLFGVRIHDSQYSSNVPRELRGERLEGFVLDFSPTNARVVACYGNGKPAITEHAFGDGTAVVLGYEASLGCFKRPGTPVERAAVDDMLGGLALPYRCEQTMVFRLAAPDADHYFYVNEGPAVDARLETSFVYRGAHDAVTGEQLALDEGVAVPGYGARWVRCVKMDG